MFSVFSVLSDGATKVGLGVKAAEGQNNDVAIVVPTGCQ